MTKTVAIVGAGQIGFAASEAFCAAGWDVTVLARSQPHWLGGTVRFEPYALGEHPAPSADVVVDSIAYDAEDVARYDPDAVGRLIAISSASVYVDYSGRSLETAGDAGYPDFTTGVTEEQPTVRPGPDSYSTRKVRMEQAARERFDRRATILRPGAIYGPWSRHPREWWFVNRLKDRRKVIPLAFDGASEFHTTNVRLIGDFAALAAAHDLPGIFNVADIQSPSVLEIGRAIASVFGKRVRFHRIEGPPQGSVGRTPWSLPDPFRIDIGKLLDASFEALGPGAFAYNPIEATDWLRAQRFDDWRTAFPQLAAYPWDLFDYEAEDRFFAAP